MNITGTKLENLELRKPLREVELYLKDQITSEITKEMRRKSSCEHKVVDYINNDIHVLSNTAEISYKVFGLLLLCQYIICENYKSY